jgi:hypothetical protein
MADPHGQSAVLAAERKAFRRERESLICRLPNLD